MVGDERGLRESEVWLSIRGKRSRVLEVATRGRKWEVTRELEGDGVEQ